MLKKLLAAFLWAVSIGACASDYPVAVVTADAVSSSRETPIEVVFWYPSVSEGKLKQIGNTRVFAVPEVLDGAQPVDGRFPVIVLSHGGIRAAFSHYSWVARSLARKGFIVATPVPPDPRAITASSAFNELALRSADLSSALTALQQHDLLAAHSRFEQVFGVGFFVGGAAVLSLAGMEFDIGRLMQTCNRANSTVDCAWLAREGVELTAQVLQPLAGSRKDRRIAGVLAINPEFSAAFGLSRIGVPANVLELNRSGQEALAFNDAARAALSIDYQAEPSIAAMSAFSVCTEEGKAMLTKVGSPICDEPADESRAAQQQRLLAQITSWLATQTAAHDGAP
ncbi:alpha/beta hydrolase family protein [Neptunomonas marina]|uniref:Dienelactone hydrolase n=1 Tax=Neptunomonas marina TaxID=1815562 RepID=A0A437QCI3_9GAMM|nr:hypothetical protein [Neptunomonas marina]RVU32270.1 hypothetical protein EOE65_01050 [Neptunomonas marina]